MAVSFALISPLLVGCEQALRAHVCEQREPLRAPSLEPWRDRRIGDEHALEFALKHRVLLLDGADHVEAVLDGQGQMQLTPVTRSGRPAAVGSAIAITDDGYFLTAAHCVRDPDGLLIARSSDGRWLQSRYRIVWSAQGERPRCDWALIAAPICTAAAAPWSDVESAGLGMPILVVGNASRGASSNGDPVLPLCAGVVTAIGAADDASRVRFIEVDAPVFSGDSGGPVLTPDGRLVGIVIQGDVFRPTSTAIRTDPAQVASIIERDRSTRARNNIDAEYSLLGFASDQLGRSSLVARGLLPGPVASHDDSSNR